MADYLDFRISEYSEGKNIADLTDARTNTAVANIEEKITEITNGYAQRRTEREQARDINRQQELPSALPSR